MNSKTSNQLKTAAQAFLNGKAVESFEGSDDQNRTAEAWLFEAWSRGTVDGVLEALLQVQELDPENDLAQRGLDWADGLSNLAKEVLTREQNLLDEDLSEAFGSDESEVAAEETELEASPELLAAQTDAEDLDAESEQLTSDDECSTELECSEVEPEENTNADTDTAKTTLFGFEISDTFGSSDESSQAEAEQVAEETVLEEEEEEPQTDEEESKSTSDALSSLESLFKPSLATETEDALSSLDASEDTEAEATEEVVYWAGDSVDDSTEEKPIAELDESETEAEAQRLADEAEEQRLAAEAEAKRLAEEAEAQRLADEAEEQRLAAEAEAKRLAEEAEAQRLADEAEEQRLADEAEAKRLAEEAEAQRLADEAEEQRLADEAEAIRLAEEAEAQRLADEAEELRLAEEAEAQRLADEAAAEAKRQADEILALQQAEEQQRSEEKAAAETARSLSSRDVAPTIMFDPSQLTQSNESDTPLRTSEVTIEVAPVAAEVVEEEIQQNLQELSDEVSEVVADVTPVAGEASESETPESSELKSDGPLVMAVDDSPTIRKLVSMTLEREGFRVITAADGLEALQLLSDHMPDIILSDVNMPRLDGYKLCRFVKKHERTKHIPVVMLSGKDGVFDKLRGKMFGCGDYITKPFDSADLVDKVRLHTGSYTS